LFCKILKNNGEANDKDKKHYALHKKIKKQTNRNSENV